MRPLLIQLLRYSLIQLHSVWLLQGSMRTLSYLVVLLTTSKACANTPHTLAWVVPPMVGGAHCVVVTTLLLTPLILLCLLLPGCLLCRLALNCVHSHDVIGPTPLRCSLLILASDLMALPRLRLSRLPLRSHMINTISCLNL